MGTHQQQQLPQEVPDPLSLGLCPPAKHACRSMCEGTLLPSQVSIIFGNSKWFGSRLVSVSSGLSSRPDSSFVAPLLASQSS